MVEGIISHIVPEKGFGFIKTDEHENGIFFHAKSLKNTVMENLQKGDKVSIDEVRESEKGYAAYGVRAIY